MQSSSLQRIAQTLSSSASIAAASCRSVAGQCRAALQIWRRKQAGQLPSSTPGVLTKQQAPREHGFGLIESMMGIAILSLSLAGVFTLNAQVLRLLKLGKESLQATEIIQERMEQLRTGIWENVTTGYLRSAVLNYPTATATNLREVTETVRVESLANPLKTFSCTRTPAGAQPTQGIALDTETSIKVTVTVQWTTHRRTHSRSMVTVMTKN